MGETGQERGEVAELFDEHGARAFRYARAMGLSHADADDIVAESFLRVLRSRDAFRGDSPFSAWLFKIMRNQLLERMRRESRLRARHEVGAAHGGGAVREDSARQAERAEMRTAVGDAIAMLKDDERAALSLVAAGKLSYREAAAVEGVSSSALASRVLRARQAIRRHLVEKGFLEA